MAASIAVNLTCAFQRDEYKIASLEQVLTDNFDGM